MKELLTEYYLWLKAAHIIAVITWMAGMLYLPRIFVYHCQVDSDSEASEKFKIMERKLLRVIINPSMILVFILGILLIFPSQAAVTGWFHVKILLVLVLAALHGMMARYRKDFEKGQNKKSEKFYRLFNEIPALIMIAIVVLAVVKPI